MSKQSVDKNQKPQNFNPATGTVLWVGNLADNVTEGMLYELFLQVGPIKCIKIPKDRSVHKGYCFIQFVHPESVPYTVRVMEGTMLFGKKLKFEPRSDGKQSNEVPKIIQELFNQFPS